MSILKPAAGRCELLLRPPKKIKKLNQKGIALLNVIIFSGLLGLMGLAFMQLTDQQNKSLETSKANFELYEFVDKTRIALSSPEACFETFKNHPYANDFSVTTLNRTFVDSATQIKKTIPFASTPDEVAPG